MLILNAVDVRAALPMQEAIQAIRWSYEAWSAGAAVMPPRIHLDMPASQGTSLFMPAFLPMAAGTALNDALIVKVVSVFPGNPAFGQATIQGAALVLDSATGACVALVDGAALTAIRTGAGSGVATALLARPDSRTLAIIGTGAQALTQVQGVCAVRLIETVWVAGRDRDRMDAFIARLADLPGVTRDVHAASDVREALRDADIVCTATTSAEALFDEEALKPGTHVNAVGAFRATMREIPATVVRRSLLFVDCKSAALKEAGDIVRAIADGAIASDHIAGELGELIAGRMAGRTNVEEITLFKSVGMAVQDAAAAHVAVSRALAAGIGQHVHWE